ncbi:MAG TPA: MFS transporter [Herpetosiphonaceae bacterium]
MRSRFSVLWRHTDFLKLWAGETVSLVGSQITTFALPLVAVLVLDATPVQVGILNAAGFAPFLLLTLPAGVWLDRRRRRPTMILTNVGRALLLGLVPLLAALGQLRIEYLYVIVFLSGMLTVFFQLAYQAYLPAVVEREHIIDGNSKLAASASISEIGGPGIGSLLVALFTAPFALVADACSFAVSALLLALIRKPEAAPEVPVQRQTFRRDVAEGFRLTFTNPFLRVFAAEAATYNLFWRVIETVFVLYIVRELRLPQEVYGLILTAGSIGALLGALLTERIARRLGIGMTIFAGALLSDVAPLLLPLATGPTPVLIALLTLSFFLRGFGTTGCNVQIISIRQLVTPDRLRGRMNASYRLLVTGTIPIGALLGGFLGEWIGLQLTLLVGALGLLSTWLWLWFSPVIRLRALPPALDEPPTRAGEVTRSAVRPSA